MHTKGPWSFNENHDTGDDLIVNIEGKAVLGVSEWASLSDEDGQLMAAAPDLLIALQTFVAEYVELVESGDAGFWNAEEEPKVMTARAAIAKATGAAA